MVVRVQQCEITLFVDSNGDYAVGGDLEGAKAAYTETIGPVEDCEGFRVVGLTVDVPLPEIVELAGVCPELGAVGKLTVKA